VALTSEVWHADLPRFLRACDPYLVGYTLNRPHEYFRPTSDFQTISATTFRPSRLPFASFCLSSPRLYPVSVHRSLDSRPQSTSSPSSLFPPSRSAVSDSRFTFRPRRGFQSRPFARSRPSSSSSPKSDARLPSVRVVFIVSDRCFLFPFRSVPLHSPFDRKRSRLVDSVVRTLRRLVPLDLSPCIRFSSVPSRPSVRGGLFHVFPSSQCFGSGILLFPVAFRAPVRRYKPVSRLPE